MNNIFQARLKILNNEKGLTLVELLVSYWLCWGLFLGVSTSTSITGTTPGCDPMQRLSRFRTLAWPSSVWIVK
jgi:hypothetical protein